MHRERKPNEVRFWAKVDKNGPVPECRPDLGPCWLWLSGKDDGYGRFSFWNGASFLKYRAHRYAYELLVGPIHTENLDHLCRVRDCVNPAHLEQVTSQENTLRGVSPPAVNAKLRHCVNGHPFDYDAHRRRPQRICKICKNAKAREDRRRNALQRVS
jgi:hypothetical protein